MCNVCEGRRGGLCGTRACDATDVRAASLLSALKGGDVVQCGQRQARIKARAGARARRHRTQRGSRACVRTVRGARALRERVDAYAVPTRAGSPLSAQKQVVCVRSRVGSQGAVSSHRLCVGQSHMGRRECVCKRRALVVPVCVLCRVVQCVGSWTKDAFERVVRECGLACTHDWSRPAPGRLAGLRAAR